MYLKTYRGTSVRELLAQAREELGPNALVLATRLVQADGWKGWFGSRVIELQAAAERKVSESRPTESSSRPSVVPDSEIVALLSATGLDRDLASEVAGAIPAGGRRGVSAAGIRKALGECLVSYAAGDQGYCPVEVFVGPPGVGKTTTIAKIAAQQRAADGGRLTLVSADGYRVGAIEQLRLYADIIGAPFKVARTAGELSQALTSSRGGGSVLIDTAGRSPRDEVAQELFSMLRSRTDVRTHLVVSAATSAKDVSRTIDEYRCARPHRIALTRVDQAETLSPLMKVLRDEHLPVSYLGTGQRVPEDLDRATGINLAGLVLGESPFLDARTA
ncbi:MAG: AAA family ATPase [Acidobacteriota bacterium]